MSTRTTQPMKNGFTLTELLICMGIIAVLMALLFPVFTQARRSSQKTSCQASLHQTGLDLRLYVIDNDEVWPAQESWDSLTFTKNHLQGCPQAVVPNAPYNPLGVLGYAYNTAFTTTEHALVGAFDIGIQDKSIVYPSNTVSVCEAELGRSFSFGPNPYLFTSTHEPPKGVEKGWLRHNNGSNYLFSDGHVKWYGPNQVGSNELGTNHGDKPTFAL